MLSPNSPHWLLMLREAHGVDTDHKGGERMLQSGDIPAASEHLHPQLLKLLRDAGN